MQGEFRAPLQSVRSSKTSATRKSTLAGWGDGERRWREGDGGQRAPAAVETAAELIIQR